MSKEMAGLVDELKKYRKVEAIIIFGSQAKKKAKPLSDIDIAVIARDPDKRTESEIAGFSSKIFDVVSFHRLPLYIQFEVLKYGNPVFVRNKGYLVQVKREVTSNYLEMSHSYERMSRMVLA